MGFCELTPEAPNQTSGLCRVRKWSAGSRGPDPLPFLSRQTLVVWSLKDASQVVPLQLAASGPGRSASTTTAPTCVAALSCLISGCYQLLTASQGTHGVGEQDGGVGRGSRFKDQYRSETGGSWVGSRGYQ